MGQAASAQTYDFSVPANGAFRIDAVGNYFLIKTATGALNVRMGGTSSLLKGLIQGQGSQNEPFVGLELFNPTGAAITGTMLIADGGFFDLNLILSGGISVRPEPISASTNVRAALAVSTAEQVLAPASNTNGAIVYRAALTELAAGAVPCAALLYKTSAPANALDGTSIVDSVLLANNAGVSYIISSTPLSIAAYVPAGNGIYWISDLAGLGATSHRTVSYKLL